MGTIDEIPSHAASPPFSAKTGCRFTELKTWKKKTPRIDKNSPS